MTGQFLNTGIQKTKSSNSRHDADAEKRDPSQDRTDFKSKPRSIFNQSNSPQPQEGDGKDLLGKSKNSPFLGLTSIHPQNSNLSCS
mmetsp:Transcript_2234/g.3380  ORF Transcript_2234/g.3380 Transcript_2234/m.3380 type:complete len:86 (+) Transcript_2234:1059-1316(+)